MSAGYMRGCAGKARHESREGAQKQRQGLMSKYRLRADQMSAYRCIQCLGWHVGGTANSFKTRTRNGKRPNKRMRGRV